MININEGTGAITIYVQIKTFSVDTKIFCLLVGLKFKKNYAYRTGQDSLGICIVKTILRLGIISR